MWVDKGSHRCPLLTFSMNLFVAGTDNDWLHMPAYSSSSVYSYVIMRSAQDKQSHVQVQPLSIHDSPRFTGHNEALCKRNSEHLTIKILFAVINSDLLSII